MGIIRDGNAQGVGAAARARALQGLEEIGRGADSVLSQERVSLHRRAIEEIRVAVRDDRDQRVVDPET